MMKILSLIPTKSEFALLSEAAGRLNLPAETAVLGRVTLTAYPKLGLWTARGGLGKVQFAVTTQHLIDQEQWDLVICAGAAGALADHLAVGDVVIGTETVEHDIFNHIGQPLLPRYAGAARALDRCREALAAAAGFGVHFGPIASGDEDIVTEGRRQEIAALTGALAVAWEGAGGARACEFNGVPFLEIRGVSDNADASAAAVYVDNLPRVMENIAEVLTALARAR